MKPLKSKLKQWLRDKERGSAIGKVSARNLTAGVGAWMLWSQA